MKDRRHRRHPVTPGGAAHWTAGWLAFALTAVATSAGAQTTTVDAPGQSTPLPSRYSRVAPVHAMGLTVSLSGDTSDEESDRGSRVLRPVADVDTTLGYHRHGRRIEFDLNGQSIVRRTDTAVKMMRQQGIVDISIAGMRQQFHASQGVSYAPSYQFGGITDFTDSPEMAVADSHGDFANSNLTALALDSTIDWTRTLSRRFVLSTSYNFRRTTFDRAGLDMTSYEAGAGLTRRLTRYASLRTGYAYRSATTGLTPGRPLRIHDVDAGIDFSRPVTLSKRTTISFGSGSSLTPTARGLAFHLTGDAAVTRRMARTWRARLGVTRSVRLVEGFAQPVLDNAINTTLTGNPRRRLSLSASGSVSTGKVGLDGGKLSAYANWTTASGLSVAVGRWTTFDAQYFCAGERFNRGVSLPPGLENHRMRQGLRVGVTWHAPLLR
jgi:hypothetical protein